jgi:inhibitor of cysteine peptidase
MCTQALVPFEESIDLDVRGLPAGTYTVDVHGETATFTLDVDNVLEE